MKTMRHRGRDGAFTLIELLCVVAIIGILAALLLPALSRVRARALRAECLSQLREAGVAFHSFAHDHNGQFPMTVPASAGGSQEFAQNAYRFSGEFYFGFRHFQALSNELVTPRLLVCPADSRLAAASFAVLSNQNVSYFVGLNADYARPNSILAGDRNLTNDWVAPATMQRLGPNDTLRWTDELHRFKGNLLFADGRVEERNNPGLAPANNQFLETAVLVLPTVLVPPSAKSPETPVPPGPAAAGGAGQVSPAGPAPIVATRPQGAATPPAWSTVGARAPGQAPKTNLDRHAADRATGQPTAKAEGQDLGLLPSAQGLGSVATEPPPSNAWAAYLLFWMVLAALVGLALRQRLRATARRATPSRR